MKFDHEVKTGGGSFIKLKDGEAVVGVLRGEIATNYVVWEGKKTVSSTEENPNAKFQFKANLVVTEGGQLVAKILQQGTTVYKQLQELAKAGYDLEKHAVRISRVGSGATDTKYTVLAMPKGEVTPEVEAQLQRVVLLDLNRD